MKQTQQLSCTNHERTINNSTKTEQKIEKIWYLLPIPPPKPQHKQTTPNLPIPPIILSNTMIMISLAQMRQSNGCGNVKNDVIFNLHLGSGAGSWVSIPCLLQDTTQKHLLYPPKQSCKKKPKILKKDQTSAKSYCIVLAYIHRTQG